MDFAVLNLFVFLLVVIHQAHGTEPIIDDSVFTNAITKSEFTDAVFYGITENCVLFLTHTVKGLHEILSKHPDRTCAKTHVQVILKRKKANEYIAFVFTMDGYLEGVSFTLPLKNREKPNIMKIKFKNKFAFTTIENFYDEINNRVIMIVSDRGSLDNNYVARSFQFNASGSGDSGADVSHNFALTNFYEVWKFYGDTLAGGYVYAHGQNSVRNPVFAINYGIDNEAKPIEVPWEANDEFEHLQNFAAYGPLWVFLVVEKRETLRVMLANGQSFEKYGTALKCTECEFNGFLGVRGVVAWDQTPPSKRLSLRYIKLAEKNFTSMPSFVFLNFFICIIVFRQY